MSKLWFKAKRYGYGWYPSTWEGWLVLAAYLAFVMRISFRINAVALAGGPMPVAMFVLTFLATAALLAVAALKGEPAKWRWGGK